MEFLRSAYDLAPAVVDAFAPFITWTREGKERVAGLDAQWQSAALKEPLKAPKLDEVTLAKLRDHEETWPKWLAATHAPTKIQGRFLRREGSGELLSGALTIEGRAEVEGETAVFSLELLYAVAPPPKSVAFVVPPDATPPNRDRTWLMVKDVVGDALEKIYARDTP